MKAIITSTHPDLALLVLRLGAGGFMLLSHGLPKLLSFGDKMHQFPDPLGVGSVVSLALAVFAEAFCALAVVVGIGTRLATVPLITTMLVAAFLVHGSDPWIKKEFALLYAVVFIALFLTGGGRYRVRAGALVRLERWS